MRKALVVAMVLAGCGGTDGGSGTDPEVAAWCAELCRESRTGACWSAEDGGIAGCEANCLAVGPGVGRRYDCANTITDGCTYVESCVDLGPPSARLAAFSERCNEFCGATATCRATSNDECLGSCVDAARSLGEHLWGCAYCPQPDPICDPLFGSD